MTDHEDFDDENRYDDEDRALTDQMLDVYGGWGDWKADAEEDRYNYTVAYRNFLENGCRGILTYEQAVEAYKWRTGNDPDRVTSWPELDWVKKRREECEAEAEPVRVSLGLSLEEFNATHWPYEPMIRYQY